MWALWFLILHTHNTPADTKSHTQTLTFCSIRCTPSMQLCRLLSLLTYWSPVLEGVSWLPPFVFPFMHTFGTTKSSLFPCFEILATLLGV